MRWFQSLLPKQGRLFSLFEAHAAMIAAAADELQGMLSVSGLRDMHIAAVAEHEQEADVIRQQVLDDVRRVFVTPFDRSAIIGLINAMDDAIDQTNRVAKTVRLYDITSFDSEMLSLATIAIEASSAVMEAAPLLRAISQNADKIHALTSHIVALEERADAIHEAGIRTLFKSDGDAITFVVRRELYQQLERIIDRLEDVATEIHGLVIDHA